MEKHRVMIHFVNPAFLPPNKSEKSAPSRCITAEAGRAIERLGHSIDYLIDESRYNGISRSTEVGRLEAIRILKTINRQIYFECPPLPTKGKRLGFFLHLFGRQTG